MTDAWSDLIHGELWESSRTLWVEDDIEYSGQQVGRLAAAIETVIADHGAVRVVRIQSRSKLGCCAGQLAAWRAGCVPVPDDGNLGASEIDQVRPDLTLAVRIDPIDPTPHLDLAQRADSPGAPARLPAEVVAVNFTSGSTGTRRAVAVTRTNLLALFACGDLDVPVRDALTAGSFATPTYDGWWFDTWRTISAGGTVVCLPNVNEDVFAWPDLVEKYHIDRLLLPAAVIATIIEAVPAAVAGIPWLFSGGEEFQVATYRQARDAGLTNRFVNLYGPTEATFATHKYELPERIDAAAIPIGQPLQGCRQSLRDLGDHRIGARELVVSGPFVCPGYIVQGALTPRSQPGDPRPSFRTGDVVRQDEDGNLVFAGRLDSQIKVNGMRVDAAALEQQVNGLPKVFDCRVVQNDLHTVAFVRADTESSSDLTVRGIESVVRSFSPAIGVQLVDRFPMKSGGKVDTTSLMNQHRKTEKVE